MSDRAKIEMDAKAPGLHWANTDSGRYLRVIYVPVLERDTVFVVTAYELAGKPLAAFRRRRRKKHQ